MSNFEFFYADIHASMAILSRYPLDEWVHANNGVVASKLRGGLLTDCNIRFSFLPHPQGNVNYRQEDQDYKNQQIIIFEEDLYFRVVDKYYLDDTAQVLMSPVGGLDGYGLDTIIRAARSDFRSSLRMKPVDILNNIEWKRRVSIVPGVDAKNSPKKGFMTEYWK